MLSPRLFRQWIATFKGEMMTIQDYGVIFSVCLSLVSGGFVVYREYFSRPKLHTSLDNITFMRIGGADKSALLNQMLVDDLSSKSPSEAALKIAADLGVEPGRKSQERLKLEIHEAAGGKNIVYNAPESLVVPYLSDIRFNPTFASSLIVYNSGRKHSHVSALALIAHPKHQPDKKWAFTAFMQISMSKLLERTKVLNDAERLSGFFSGFVIGSGQSVEITPWFTPIHTLGKTIVSNEAMPIGDYLIKVSGFDIRGKRVFQTQAIPLSLTREILLASFNGGETMINNKTDAAVLAALHR